MSSDAGLKKMVGTPALQSWDCVSETFCDAEGNLTDPSDKRHSFSHSIDRMSLDMIGHVSSNIPKSSFRAKLHFFEDNDAVIRMIFKKDPL